MNSYRPTFKRVSAQYRHGVVGVRQDGINVEVVRCSAGDWDVFMTLDGHVVAVSLLKPAYKRAMRMTYNEAMSLGTTILKSTN